MTNNKDEEHLDDQRNTKAENSSDEIIPTRKTDPINQIPETENMEVHKHPHHVTHKKKWGEYLLEFFMLFLAVFLGFVVENWREHIVEKSRAHQFLQSMQVDVRTNMKNLDSLLAQDRAIIANHDSL